LWYVEFGLFARAPERQILKTLVYKRTHRGDPDESGCFGIQDCMGRVRSYDFDAVIGVGGISSQPRAQGIAEKINWIGLGARKRPHAKRKGPLVTFDHFCLYEERGKKLHKVARNLAKHLYSKNARVLLNFTPREQKEIDRILNMAKNARRSAGLARLPHLPNHTGCNCCGSVRC
jgi:hypothetical protein